MWGANFECHINCVAHVISLDFVLIVVVFEAFADPDVAGGGIKVGLVSGDLKFALDVAVVVCVLVVKHLLAAGGGHGRASEAGGWGGDEAVAGDQSSQAGGGQSVERGFHDVIGQNC